MVADPELFYISPEDYLEAERVSPIKHEYRRGKVTFHSLAWSGALADIYQKVPLADPASIAGETP